MTAHDLAGRASEASSELRAAVTKIIRIVNTIHSDEERERLADVFGADLVFAHERINQIGEHLMKGHEE